MAEYLERETAVMRLMQDGCSAKNATILDGHEVGLRATRADFYCADGERRTDE